MVSANRFFEVLNPPSTTPLFASRFFLQWLPLMALGAVIAHYAWFVYTNSFNVPWQDDIPDYLLFMNLVEAAESTRGAITEWFRQYNDHRTAASRLLVYFAYLAEGEVNFRSLTLLANAALPLILLLFYLNIRHEKYSGLLLLSTAFILLSLRSWTLVLWSQAAITYYFVFFYAFACLFALHKVTVPKFVLAAIFCTLSSFTYASGQLVWLLGLVSLIHQSRIAGRLSLIYPAIWLIVAAVMLVTWHAGFVSVAKQIDPSLPGSDLFFGVLLNVDLAGYIKFFLVILGSAVTDSNTRLAGASGLGILALLSFITARYYKSEDVRLVLCCWFIVASAAAVSTGRAFVGTEYILVSRYSFLSVLLASTLILLTLHRFAASRAIALYLVVVMAGTYCVWTYRHFDAPLQKMLEVRYKHFNAEQFWLVFVPASETNAIVGESVARGIYNPICRPIPDCLASKTASK